MFRNVARMVGSKVVVSLTLAASLAASQAACSAQAVDGEAHESESALGESAADMNATFNPDGSLTLRDQSGSPVFSGFVDTSAFEEIAEPNGDVTYRFRDGTSIRASKAGTFGNQTRVRLEWSSGRVVYVNAPSEGNADTGGGGEGGGLSPRAIPLAIPIVVGIAILVGGTAYFFTSKGCNDALLEMQKACYDKGGTPQGGGCEISWIVYYKLTPPECHEKKKVSLTPVQADHRLAF